MSSTRIGALVVAICAGSMGLAGPASADTKLIRERPIGVADCSTVGSGQICPANPKNNWDVQDQLLVRKPAIFVEFIASPSHCSDIVAHVFFDGREVASSVVGPGQSDGGHEIPVEDSAAGLNMVAVQAEGVTGGCNTGTLASWAGRLRTSQVV
jgi:hypothetical protein